MNTSFLALAGAALLIGCPWASAASNTDLTVTGSITPSACTPSLSNSGAVDLGKISIKDLRPDGWTILWDTMLQLRVSCEAQTRFALVPTDNRPEHTLPANPETYGMGVIDDALVGVYRMHLLRPVVDGKAVNVLGSTDSGQTWTVIPPGWGWVPKTLTAFGDDWWTGAQQPIASKEFTVDLRIRPSIPPTRTLPVEQTLPLDGSATLDLVYL
ncbi:hypothetical protein BK648_02850 [Pseudomonas poae]|uniref:DUF1120 domain-containing protein n=1 Tax=Pseudomonas poae TaxID=200451 RepID=A0A423FIH8_9PSED|nr:DUF1120 domain-containing protein [Pseudomonas poae]ROM57724.1 hypothetical protein BK648_02850 [Pseudomonas poae]